MYRLARTFFDGHTYTWEVSLWDNALSSHAGNELRLLTHPILECGNSGASGPLAPLLPTDVTMQVYDVGKTLTAAMERRPDSDFRVQIRRDGQLYFQGPAYLKSSANEGRSNPTRRLIAYDGLTLLKDAALESGGTRTIARWLYDLLSLVPGTQQGLHTYSDWAAASQTGIALQGLYANAQTIVGAGTDASGGDASSAHKLLTQLARVFGLQIGSRKGEWRAVQRSYRLAETATSPLVDAPEGTGGVDDEFFKVAIDDGDVLSDGGAARPMKKPHVAPAGRVSVTWDLHRQTPHRNTGFDSDRGTLFGWEANGVAVQEDTGAVRLDSTSDVLKQRFNAPPLPGTEAITEIDSDEQNDVAKLLFHDVTDGSEYTLNPGGNWEAGTTEFFQANYGRKIKRAVEISSLPGSGLGYLQISAVHGGNGTFTDVYTLGFEPPASGYESASYSAEFGASQRTVEVKTPIGSLDTYSGDTGLLMTGTGGAIAEDFDGDTDGRQPFPAEVVRDLASQQVARLRGLDVWLGPSAPEADVFSTLIYEGLACAPVYEREVIGKNVRRLVAYEIRADSIPAVDTTWSPEGKVADEEDAGAPLADFSASVTDKTADTDASASRDPDGSIQSYEWDWGDGSTTSTTDATTNHTYSDAGDYTIVLTVTDDTGKTDTYSQEVTIENDPPTASFTTSSFTRYAEVDASGSSAPDGTIVRYDWEWGDGTQTLQGSVQEQHDYGQSGTFTITLTVTDDNGNTDSTRQSVTV